MTCESANCEDDRVCAAFAVLPHGALLICDPVTFELRRFSRNLAKLTGFPGDMFPGLAASEVLGRQVLHDLRNAAARSGRGTAKGMLTGLRLPWTQTRFDATIHRQDGAALIEIEPAADAEEGAAKTLELTRQLIGRMTPATDSQRLCEMGARLAQAMLGFDRVTVCHLRPDGTSGIVAESLMGKLAGLKGSDLPGAILSPGTHADPIRLIPEVDCIPVPLEPPLQPGETPVDLSHACLRTLSPRHRACLRDMGVGAMMTIPVNVEGAPWGLILCHHPRPLPVPPALRVSAELLGHCFSLQLALAERGEAERRHALVNAELNHRVKNLLSLVKSIALQTGSTAASVEDYARLLEGRLQALADAHDRSLGEGEGTLSELIEAEALPHRSDAAPDRIAVEGPALRLSDRAHGMFALAIHEMMTNAVKYGALSVPQGRLAIRWRHDPAAGLALHWRESGGPAVRPPRRMGFGSRLIRNVLEYDLKGRAEIDFAPEGLAACFRLPAPHAAPAPPARQPGPVQAASVSLRGLSVLVVEDQGLIAMDIEAVLRGMGAVEIRLAASGTDALTLLDHFRPNLAILDFDLGPETSEPVAAALLKLGCPFMFMTGYGDHAMLPPELRHIPLARKPVSPAAIARNAAAARTAMRR
ncbi:HWE histidine kinase domain-containing protein [uncultured Paracoccus sp.]|uniref:HWE histidine kinase domain-containing protein n=1 Tax=uncultured Paracoccus sp. TaxID=189685 RepID=UPI0025DB48E5|nr:HWE histidine kinase domain-containing protein [uncultured Paracoccus sp.]